MDFPVRVPSLLPLFSPPYKPLPAVASARFPPVVEFCINEHWNSPDLNYWTNCVGNPLLLLLPHLGI